MVEEIKPEYRGYTAAQPRAVNNALAGVSCGEVATFAIHLKRMLSTKQSLDACLFVCAILPTQYTYHIE